MIFKPKEFDVFYAVVGFCHRNYRYKSVVLDYRGYQFLYIGLNQSLWTTMLLP